LFGDLVDEWLGVDNRLLRTVRGLFWPPGETINDYLSGKRARHVPPLKLYLVISALFFLTLQIAGTDVETGVADGMAGQSVQEGERSSVAADDNVADDLAAVEGEGKQNDEVHVNIGLLRWLPEEWAGQAKAKLKAGAQKFVRLAKDDPDAALGALLQQMPVFLFLMMPFFALWLKILYIGSGRMYMEHLTVALYSHSAIFLLLWFGEMAKLLSAQVGIGAIGTVTTVLVWLAIPFGLLSTQKRVYGQGWWWTTFKFVVAGLGHLLLLATFLSMSVIASLLRF
jgi:hypothetical protein